MENIEEVGRILQVNFGPGNIYGRTALVQPDQDPVKALVVILEHYMKWQERCVLAETYIGTLPAFTNTTIEQAEAYIDWRNKEFNMSLHKEFNQTTINEDSDNRASTQQA